MAVTVGDEGAATFCSGTPRGGWARGQIHINAVFSDIDPNRLDEFKALAHELLRITNDDDGVQNYDWYVSDDGTRCVVRETYVDSAAVLAHLPLVNEHLARMGEICGAVEGDILGDASPDLQAMTGASGVHLCRHLQSK
jgi:quinol monooxygenase YgiN